MDSVKECCGCGATVTYLEATGVDADAFLERVKAAVKEGQEP